MSARTALLWALLALAALLPSKAAADTEYCPALLISQPGDAAASSFAYRLEALSRRRVDATLIADTDHGWYSWNLGKVWLESAFFDAGPGSSGGYLVAVSPVLAVDFPVAVRVFRAWVLDAKTFGDSVFDWDRDGRVRCEVPDFENAAPSNFIVADLPLRAPADPPPPVVAAPARPPLELHDCDRPFRAVRSTQPIAPEFPAAAVASFQGHDVSTDIEVAVDELGRPTEAWTLSSTGFSALDRATLRAALASSYVPAESYCRTVPGYYFLRADFSGLGAVVSVSP